MSHAPLFENIYEVHDLESCNAFKQQKTMAPMQNVCTSILHIPEHKAVPVRALKWRFQIHVSINDDHNENIMLRAGDLVSISLSWYVCCVPSPERYQNIGPSQNEDGEIKLPKTLA